MLMIGCDFHTRFQHIAMLDTATGEIVERALEHETGEAISCPWDTTAAQNVLDTSFQRRTTQLEASTDLWQSL